MARKPRDYKAEYAARQARSKRDYGVSYNVQRKLVDEGKKGGLSAATIRQSLRAARGKTPNVSAVIKGVIRRQADAAATYRAGGTVAWDPFAECINVDLKGNLCEHIPSQHRPEAPHPCSLCSCPAYIHPEDIDMPNEMFWYHS